MSREYVEIDVVYDHQTKKAIDVLSGIAVYNGVDYAKAKESGSAKEIENLEIIWIPVSLIGDIQNYLPDLKKGDEFSLEVEEWFAIKAGLV